jgi:hypothetical protein
MPSGKSRFVVPFPRLGNDRSGPFDQQKPGTTPKSLNVWTLDPSTDSYRGGVRPVLKSIGSVGGAGFHWCRATYLDGSSITQSGIAVAHGGGCSISLTGADWGTPPDLTESVGTDFSSCAVYQQYLVLARGGTTAYTKSLPAGADTVLTATAGTAPTKCGIVVTHADRLWLMGDTDSPSRVRASAVGDMFDWDYADPTEGGAFESTGAEGSILSDAVIAGISHDDNWLFIGCRDAIWASNGNPKIGGLRKIHDSLGPLTNRAWCKGEGPTGSNDTYIMTRAGFGVIRQGSLQFEMLSDGPNMRDLKGLNPGTPTSAGDLSGGDDVVVGYDSRWKQVHIFVNPSSGSDYGYAFDVRTGAFWPQDFSSTISLIPTMPKLQTEQRSTALLISSGGSVFQFDSAESQGGVALNETFDSELYYMVPLAHDGDEGILHTITATLAEGSENVDWGVYVADTAEQAFRFAEDDTTNSSPDFAGAQWSATSSRLLNYVQHVRMKGGWACVKIWDVDGKRWLIETLFAEVLPSGRRRVG